MARPAIKARRGKECLRNTSMKRLKQCHKKEKDLGASARLTAYMQRKDGKTAAEIAAIVNRCESTVRDWLARA